MTVLVYLLFGILIAILAECIHKIWWLDNQEFPARFFSSKTEIALFICAWPVILLAIGIVTLSERKKDGYN